MSSWPPINKLFETPNEECFYAPRYVKDLYPSNGFPIPFPTITIGTEGTFAKIDKYSDKCYGFLCMPEVGFIIAFVTGMIFAPWAWGLFYLILFIVIFELLYYIMVWGDQNKWDPIYRGARILFYVAGWVFGRWLFTDVLFPNDLPQQYEGPWQILDHGYFRRLH